jgi:hypothetical protein
MWTCFSWALSLRLRFLVLEDVGVVASSSDVSTSLGAGAEDLVSGFAIAETVEEVSVGIGAIVRVRERACNRETQVGRF